jgi:tRNA (adenine-N(1)-)-methyltransferase non-catalytic subunit
MEDSTVQEEAGGATNSQSEEPMEETTTAAAAEEEESSSKLDPLQKEQPTMVREGDYILLVFADDRKIFAQALRSKKGKSPPVKINKRSYPTANLIGLEYGTVLELGSGGLVPLPEGEGVLPDYPAALVNGSSSSNAKDINVEEEEEDSTFPSLALEQKNDNRNLVDNNKSQSLQFEEIHQMRQDGTHGSDIVEKLIENSATFDQKTEFSKAKYIKKKQQKYQQRCRIVRCTPFSICEAVFASRPKLLLNMREDTLGQILSHGNISAGCHVLVYEQCAGVITGALAWRMGGYGKIFSVYDGQQPSFLEMLRRYNLSFAENVSVKWVHSGDIYGDSNSDDNDNDNATTTTTDPEKEERDSLSWPCPLQNHTRGYLDTMETIKEKRQFLAKRCSRFTRKLTRQTPAESKSMLEARKSDAVIIAVRYDPTETLLGLLPHLAPSCPFVVYCEYIEPLTECFLEMQKRKLAINLRLSDTWMREYQVLQGRTHPSMNMTQSGGFILVGTKLCPETGRNELDESLMQELRSKIGGRRGKRSSKAAREGAAAASRKKRKKDD